MSGMDQVAFRELWRRFAELVHSNKVVLNDLDAAIGDADHGSNLDRGLTRVVEALDTASDVGLRADAKLVGMTLMSTVGGASGALWGSGMLKLSALLPDAPMVSWSGFVDSIDAFVEALSKRGQAVLGDKTMMDVFLPAIAELRASASSEECVVALAVHAKGWSDGTRDLIAKRGRAAYLGPRSAGHVDPGSLSAALWFQALADTVRSQVS